MRKRLRQFDNPKWLQTDVRPHFIKALKLVHTLVVILFKTDKPTIRQVRLAPLVLLAALFPAMLLAWLHWSGFAQPLSNLGEIKERGKLVVATRYGPTTYFNGPDGPTGFEYDLIRDFAESLGVEAEFVIPENIENTLTLVKKEEANLVATGIPYSPDDANRFNLGPDYLEVSRLIVSFEEKKTIEELDKIKAPTLIVWGDQDAILPRSDQEALAAAIAGSRLVVYPGAGHALYWEEPARFASDLVAFIEDLGP